MQFLHEAGTITQYRPNGVCALGKVSVSRSLALFTRRCDLENLFTSFEYFFLKTILDKTIETLSQISSYLGTTANFLTPVPRFSVVNVVL